LTSTYGKHTSGEVDSINGSQLPPEISQRSCVLVVAYQMLFEKQFRTPKFDNFING